MYIFGGTTDKFGEENFNDLWSFSLKSRTFVEIKQGGKVKPPALYGHTLDSF